MNKTLMRSFTLAMCLIGGSALTLGGPDAALIVAAERGDTASVARLIKEGANVKTRDGSGRTARLAATQHNRVEAARTSS